MRTVTRYPAGTSIRAEEMSKRDFIIRENTLLFFMLHTYLSFVRRGAGHFSKSIKEPR